MSPRRWTNWGRGRQADHRVQHAMRPAARDIPPTFPLTNRGGQGWGPGIRCKQANGRLRPWPVLFPARPLALAYGGAARAPYSFIVAKPKWVAAEFNRSQGRNPNVGTCWSLPFFERLTGTIGVSAGKISDLRISVQNAKPSHVGQGASVGSASPIVPRSGHGLGSLGICPASSYPVTRKFSKKSAISKIKK